MTYRMPHPIADKLGIELQLHPKSHLVYSSAPGVTSAWKTARISLLEDESLEFSVTDERRSFSASFNRDGKVTALNCSTGIPNGDTEKVIELFCEEARHAFEDLVLFQ